MASRELRRGHGASAIGGAASEIERVVGRECEASGVLHSEWWCGRGCGGSLSGFEFDVDGMGTSVALVEGASAAVCGDGAEERAVVEVDG